MTVTLEAIKEKQSEITQMIAAFEQLPAFPITVPFPKLNSGEKLVSVIISADGSRCEYVILLPQKSNAATWKEQMDWAKSIGGELPDRIEGAMLFALMKDEFVEEAYWTREQHAAYSDYAWCQDFSNGYQLNYTILSKLRARAVRRLVIQ